MTSRRDRIALTGATGVLGHALQREWTDVEWLPFRGDVRDRDAVRDWLAAAEPLDAVLHLAAIVPTTRVDADPTEALAVNVGGTIHVLEAVSALPAAAGNALRPWFCLISTSHVYASSDLPIAEDAPTRPTSLYGLTKLQAEQWALAYAERHDLDVCVARLFSYSDPLQAASYFLPATIARLQSAPANGTLEVPGATDTRDFLPTSAIASALATLRAHRATGVFNVASGEGVRIAAVVERLAALLGRSDLTLQPLPNDPATHLIANIGKLRNLGWTPDRGLDGLLDQLLGG